MNPWRAVALLLLVAVLAAHAAEKDLGIVLLHGKWDRPPTGVLGLSRQLQDAGYRVVTPTMPWSGLREYDVSYPQALAEIEAAADGLRKEGASHIIVAGLSLGANAALAYAASGRPVDGVVALSPAHNPEGYRFRSRVEPSVTKAREMVAQGRGSEKAWFDDINQGRSKTIRTSAEAYLSYFDPEGAGNMRRSARAIPVPVPIFIGVGTGDESASNVGEAIYRRAPAHEKSRYVSVAADHVGVASVIAPELVAWLRSLGY
jgi:esterase/lipase